MSERELMRYAKEVMANNLRKSGMSHEQAEKRAIEIARRNEQGRGVKKNSNAKQPPKE